MKKVVKWSSGQVVKFLVLVLLFTINCSLFTVFSGCSKKAGTTEKVLAQVGDEKITVTDFNKAVETAPYALREYLSSDTGRRQYLDTMLREKTVLLTAKNQGIEKRPQVAKQLAEIESRLKDNYEKLKNELIMNELLREKVALGSNDVKNYYEKHKDEFEKPIELNVSHILSSTEADAKKIIEQLNNGKNFSKLAKENSIDKATASNGGNLGFFGKRQYVKEFEDAAYNLKKVGDVSEIVKTPLGYHIIKLIGIKQLKPQKFEDVETEIKQVIQKEKLDKWINEISKKYKAKVNYELLSKPIVPQAKIGQEEK